MSVDHDIDEAGRRSPALHRALSYLMEHGGGCGGGGTLPTGSVGPPNFFLAPIDESASVDLDQTATNYLAITAANVITNRGDAFMVEDGTNGLQHVKCLISGNYTILVGMRVEGQTAGSTRSNIVASIDVKRGRDSRGRHGL